MQQPRVPFTCLHAMQLNEPLTDDSLCACSINKVELCSYCAEAVVLPVPHYSGAAPFVCQHQLLDSTDTPIILQGAFHTGLFTAYNPATREVEASEVPQGA